MADYQKLTPAAFITKLAAGNYNGAPGARRAVGRSDWTQAEKDKAYAAVDKHFDVKEAPKAAKSTDKAAKKAAKAPKVTKVAKVEKTGKIAKKAAKVAVKGKPGRPPKSAAKPEIPQPQGQALFVAVPSSTTPEMLQSLHMAHDLVTVTNIAVGVIKTLSEKMPERSFHSELDLCGTFINRAVQLLNDNVVNPMMDEASPEKPAPSIVADAEDEEEAPAEAKEVESDRAILDRLVPVTRSNGADATA